MKKVIKFIFMIVIVVVIAIDAYGVWKYKFKETKYASAEPEQNEVKEPEVATEPPEPEIEYAELSKDNFLQNQRLFITDIETAAGQDQFEIKGLIYEEYTIDVDEYTEIKNNGGTIEIFGKVYMMERMQSYNLMLQPVEEDNDAEQFYIKYDYTNRRYILKDATTDYVVYRATDQYVSTTVEASLPFIVQKNNKTTEYTIADVADTHTKIPVPGDQVKIDCSTLSFSRNGEITKIVELIN